MAKTSRIDQDPENFARAVRESHSISEVLRKMGYAMSGGAFKFFKQKAKDFEIDYSHFTGQGWTKGQTRDQNTSIEKAAFRLETPWKKVFCRNSNYKGSNQYLLKKLRRAGKKSYYCEECGIDKWRNKPITLQLHHKNGDNIDNRVVNLAVLCPNCHSQTETHSGKNTRSCRNLADEQR